jgi:hypothetical protein
VSVLSVGLLATPVALAFAADGSETTEDEQVNYPALMDSELLAEARSQFKKAAERAERKEDRRREARQATQVAATEPAPAPEQSQPTTEGGGGAGGNLASIRECESGGDYSTNTGNGFYGAYQFTQETWESVGGSGSPASASPAEQDAAAQRLIEQSGTSPWPNCG